MLKSIIGNSKSIIGSGLVDISRLKARYINQMPTCKTDWPQHKVFHYVRLAIVEKEDVTLRDKHLNEITKY